VVQETKFVRHVRMEHPISIRVDGRQMRGEVLTTEGEKAE